jgi:transcription initiation factor TFIID subunit TAF12
VDLWGSALKYGGWGTALAVVGLVLLVGLKFRAAYRRLGSKLAAAREVVLELQAGTLFSLPGTQQEEEQHQLQEVAVPAAAQQHHQQQQQQQQGQQQQHQQLQVAAADAQKKLAAHEELLLLEWAGKKEEEEDPELEAALAKLTG